MTKMEKMNFNTPPIMFAAWPGMGNVALMAMDFLRRTVDARMFAELDMGPFYTPEEVVVENGMARFPEIPRSVFHEQHDPNLVFFESTIETEGKDALTIAETVLEVAKKLKAPRIFTAAALPQAMSYKTEPQIFAAANKESLLEELESFGIQPLNQGFISGLSGLLLGIAASRNIEAACILASIPYYATELAYPRGSIAIVNSLARVLDLSVDTSELQQQVEETDSTFADIEDRLRNILPLFADQEEMEGESETKEAAAPPDVNGEQVPEYVMARIEKLFKEVAEKKDKERAMELKNELDKWGLYKIYENRFLDLFKGEGK
jgi:predicted ATP-grasp superfamily ATP-dependent carboligase